MWDWNSGEQKLDWDSGHTNNVFQARTIGVGNITLVSCAADGQVRRHLISATGVKSTCIGKHNGRAHRLAIDPRSLSTFYSCGEDAAVRHYDLRMPNAGCTKVLVVHSCVPARRQVQVDLNSIQCDPTKPEQFLVGGDEEYAYVFDIRRIARNSSKRSSRSVFVEPVDKFCPKGLESDRRRASVSITSAVYSGSGEVLATYNDEDIYLFHPNVHGSKATAPSDGELPKPRRKLQPAVTSAKRHKASPDSSPGAAAGAASPQGDCAGPSRLNRTSAQAESQLSDAPGPATAGSEAGPSREFHAKRRELVESIVDAHYAAMRPCAVGLAQLAAEHRAAAAPSSERESVANVTSAVCDAVDEAEPSRHVGRAEAAAFEATAVEADGALFWPSRRVRFTGRAESPQLPASRLPVTSAAAADLTRDAASTSSREVLHHRGGPSPAGIGVVVDDTALRAAAQTDCQAASVGCGPAGLEAAAAEPTAAELPSDRPAAPPGALPAAETGAQAHADGDVDAQSDDEGDDAEVGYFSRFLQPPSGSEPDVAVSSDDNDEAEAEALDAAHARGWAPSPRWIHPGPDRVVQKFTGHRNCKTVKGVNFMGEDDDYIVSGSDCGHVFIWSKKDGRLRQLMKGDDDVVNCLEPNPRLKLILATSGIDSTVKIWEPYGERVLDYAHATRVMQRNHHRRSHTPNYRFGHSTSVRVLLLRMMLRGQFRNDDEEEEEEQEDESEAEVEDDDD